MLNKLLLSISAICISVTYSWSQQRTWTSGDIKIQLEKLDVLGSVLYFAAHPDDENTRLIAWLAQEKKYRTGYLSLTRGEGGQNLIGTHLGLDLGLIRTNELLAARNIDKGEQFFSSAVDFGFSKTHEETFRFWDKQSILAEAVYVIRKFRPDVIITRFPPDPRGGHGHHQASAILAHEAFLAAADSTRFPEQLHEVGTWQATRLVWNTANFGGMNNTSESQLKIDIGAYNSLLGQSYGEIAADSRSQHKSQGFGAASTRGRSIEYFEHVAGGEAKTTLMDGLTTTWERIPHSRNIQRLVQNINTAFDANHPEKILADLLLLKKEVHKIADIYWKKQKLKEIDDLILACSGIWVDAVVAAPAYTAHQDIPVQLEVIVRNPDVPMILNNIDGKPIQQQLQHNILWRGQQNVKWDSTSQPYWLLSAPSLGKFHIDRHNIGYPLNPQKPHITFTFQIGEEKIEVQRDIAYRFVDPVRGEVYQPLVVQPQLTVSSDQQTILVAKRGSKEIQLTFQNNDFHTKRYTVNALAPQGWEVLPETIDLDFTSTNTIEYIIKATPLETAPDNAPILLKWENDTLHFRRTIDYTHIPSITWFPTLDIRCQRLDINNIVQKVGYINGAGDLIPQSLANVGIEVSLLNEKQIEADYLKQFDAVVVGIRYFNVNEKSKASLAQLLKYVEQGGVVLVQYNVNSRLQAENLGPYPFRLSRDRVTEEDAKVDFDPNDPVFNYPNKITSADFDGWVQERGLYFANEIDKSYRTPIRMHDTNESSKTGSLLIGKYGKGKFVYTSLSFFRQLPAGVPGAYRLFVNLLTKEK